MKPSDTVAPQRPDWHADIRKILIIKWSAMGDVALASAAMNDVRNMFPDAVLHLSTLPPWQNMFKHDSRFDRVIDIDVRGKRNRFLRNLDWWRTICRQHYDLVIDLQTTDRSAILLGLMSSLGQGIGFRVGNKIRWPYNLAPADSPKSLHAFSRLRKTLAAAGIPATTAKPVLFPSRQQMKRANDLKHKHALADGQFVVFLPGSQAEGYLKRWGARRYAALADLIQAPAPTKILLLGGPEELDECAEIADLGHAEIVNLCGQTEILELIPLCTGARFVIANDTGTAHVVAATGVPIVCICGPTDPHRVKPAGASVSTLQAELDCINCYKKHCAHHSCMQRLAPDVVLAHLHERGLMRVTSPVDE